MKFFLPLMRLILSFSAAWMLLPVLVFAQEPITWTLPGDDEQPQIPLWFFWSISCPHCLEARPHVQEMAAKHPWIELHDLELTQHPAHVERYIGIAASLGGKAQSVPAFIYCGRMEVGWESQETSGRALLRSLEDCRANGVTPEQPGLSSLHLPWLGEVDPDSFSLPVLTILIAGMDAFNPCAFFVLLFLLSLLVHQHDRHRMMIIGSVFVLFSGLIYLAFMAAWLGLFRVMGSLPWVTTAAGCIALLIGIVNVKDFFVFKLGISLSISEGHRADIFQRGRRILNAGSLPAMLAATVFLAITANFYELLCTAGFPMVYTRLLTLHVANPATHYLFLVLYTLIYVLPLLLIVLAFVGTMGARKLSEREGRLLKLLSGLMMLGLGVMLLIAPEWLSDLRVAFCLIATSVGLTWLVGRLSNTTIS